MFKFIWWKLFIFNIYIVIFFLSLFSFYGYDIESEPVINPSDLKNITECSSKVYLSWIYILVIASYASFFIAFVLTCLALFDLVIYVMNTTNLKVAYKHLIRCQPYDIITNKVNEKNIFGCKLSICNRLVGSIVLFIFYTALSIIYFVAFLLISVARVFDIRELCWPKVNYILKNLFFFCIKLVFFIALSLNSAARIYFYSQFKVCQSTMIVQSVYLFLNVLIIILIVVEYIYFELFTPKNLIETSKKMIKKDEINLEESYKLKKYLIISRHAFNFMPEFARFMRIERMGSNGCIAANYCSSMNLEHIFYCHNALNKPNSKFRCWYDWSGRKNYLVGFHQTTYEAALAISLSPMRITKDGMFGDGVYFARSFENTDNKGIISSFNLSFY
jgi:hypothetical protein